MKKISIIMPYFNRKKQMLATLKSIIDSKHDNLEIVVVNDGDPLLDINDISFVSKKCDLVYVSIDKNDKNWINPCVPFNIGIRESNGDILILQSPECVHIGDISSFININLYENKYMAFSVLGIESENQYIKFIEDFYSKDLNYFYSKIPYKNRSEGDYIWYCHPVFRNKPYHFIAALHKKDLNKIGGFCNDFMDSVAYDDDEFILRLSRAGIELSIIDFNSVFGVHLWHGERDVKNFEQNSLKNKNRYLRMIKSDTIKCDISFINNIKYEIKRLKYEA